MKITLKQYRTMYGVKQEELAKLLGISVKTYSFKEKGLNKFYVDEYRKIYEYFCKFNKLDAGKFFLEA